ncbi:MAG: bifunctional phosphoribosylaminoimidazolecarboxamide formyltransferase/IMP cyclohydrolase [Pyrinomonadaceae bacterium]
MTEQNKQGLRIIRRALLSVSDKTGLIDFARELSRMNVELISTGGTAQSLRDAGIEVRDVSDITGFPEMMNGRVKTLHPRIHGALLALRGDESHMAAAREHGIEMIDMLVINLYPFEQTIARKGVTLEEAIEQIDIGGPAMIRSAAKNFRDVAVVVSPTAYAEIIRELHEHAGALSLHTRGRLAVQAFQRTSAYDSYVYRYLYPKLDKAGFEQSIEAQLDDGMAEDTPHNALWPSLHLKLKKSFDLRYGENPHQFAALYRKDESHLMSLPYARETIFVEGQDAFENTGIASAELFNGKEMSFNNYVDADAAWQLVCDFDEHVCAIIKHTNPAGVASGRTAAEAYRRALATDPVSAFGGIVAFNHAIDEAAARAVTEIFTEVIIAPDYEAAALETLRAKKNLRVLRAKRLSRDESLEFRTISGGVLAQTRDVRRLTRDDLTVVSKREPSDEEISSLLFAWTVCKHTKSNAIVYARDEQTIGVGAGQMSRVDSVKLGAMRAQLPVEGSVLASDAFFPFRDGVDEAARHGITAVIQPGGSVRDEEVIAAANEHNLAMVLTGVRHFKH